MYRACLFVVALCVSTAVSQASDPWFYYGRFQPYGMQVDTMHPTPPYYAIHPPVYYGQRFARPYGISPFPAAGDVGIPSSYKAVPRSAGIPLPQLNPYCQTAASSGQEVAPEAPEGSVAEASPIQVNPYVVPKARLAVAP